MSHAETDLLARLQRMEDRIAIQDLVRCYCSAIDDRDLESFAGVYAEDGLMRHADGTFRLHGRAAIRSYYAERFKTYGVTFHYPHTHQIEFDSLDTAHGQVRAHAEMVLDGQAFIAAFRYSDRYVRIDREWLFAERVLACWYYLPMSELAAGLSSEFRKHYKGERRPAELPESLPTYRALHGLG